MKFLHRKVKMPQTVAEFDKLVDKVVAKYSLSDKHHAAAIISVAIRHLPNDQGYTTLQYLGESVMKNVANYVANHKGETLRHESQIKQLESILLNEPNNQQALDEMTKAANEGSALAKETIARLYPEPKTELPANVTSING